MYISLKNKNVIITGASSGIGMEAAKLFAAEGSNLVLAARSEDKLEQLGSELNNFNIKILKLPTDVSKISDCKKLIKETVNKLGSIDILVNNAGFSYRGNVDDVDLKTIEQIIDVNFKAPIRLTNLALPYLKKSESGRIINVASILGIVPLPTEAVYSATKFALRAFSYALSEELIGTDTKVCLVCPGPVDTPMISEEIEKIHDLVFSPPISTPLEIAELILKSSKDGRLERIKPVHTGILAKIG
ncbi:MAG: SDR family NAD(P)-dependent oxidoreductase, partial [Thermodesulfobacteriota bacterium]